MTTAPPPATCDCTTIGTIEVQVEDVQSTRVEGELAWWPSAAVLMAGVLVYLWVNDDIAAGIVGFVLGAICVLANKGFFFARWQPENLTAQQKSSTLLTIKVLLLAAGSALIAMSQIAHALLYARWTPTTGWITRSGGPNSHALISYLGSVVLGIAVLLPFRAKVQP